MDLSILALRYALSPYYEQQKLSWYKKMIIKNKWLSVMRIFEINGVIIKRDLIKILRSLALSSRQVLSYYLLSNLEMKINKYQIFLNTDCHSRYSPKFGLKFYQSSKFKNLLQCSVIYKKLGTTRLDKNEKRLGTTWLDLCENAKNMTLQTNTKGHFIRLLLFLNSNKFKIHPAPI